MRKGTFGLNTLKNYDSENHQTGEYILEEVVETPSLEPFEIQQDKELENLF